MRHWPRVASRDFRSAATAKARSPARLPARADLASMTFAESHSAGKQLRLQSGSRRGSGSCCRFGRHAIVGEVVGGRQPLRPGEATAAIEDATSIEDRLHAYARSFRACSRSTVGQTLSRFCNRPGAEASAASNWPFLGCRIRNDCLHVTAADLADAHTAPVRSRARARQEPVRASARPGGGAASGAAALAFGSSVNTGIVLSATRCSGRRSPSSMTCAHSRPGSSRISAGQVYCDGGSHLR